MAGSEAAWQIAQRGIPVRLYEMRPRKTDSRSSYGSICRLVCSNSLRANSLQNAVGILKEEMRKLNSLIIRSADQTSSAGGGALAVDREQFAEEVTRL